MKIDRSLVEQLSHFGIAVGQQGKHSLQQKIIEMYDLLEQKTTQNLLLRKENDDIKLQIDTINGLFSNTPSYCATQNNFDQFWRQYQNLSLGIENSKRRAYVVQGKQNKSYAFENGNFLNFRNQQSVETDSKYDCSQVSYENERQNPSFQVKSVLCSNKPCQNSRFRRQQKKNMQESQEKTSRKESHLIQKSNKSLNQKIEFLMLQNQTILKRMNQIQVNFIKGSHEEQESKRRNQKGFDDRYTYISSNVTSIHNIRNRKDTYIEEKGLKSQGRKHYSTNNLRVYCPSVDR